ncbi:hypothetical protein Enr13x_06080 [Stieleria neptunia]|uniref:Bifunctional hemolysin/adenylate cyclase n=1 Tax=Stieleria neptunia TaxID=2527979 RepID=A0A518HIW6_9BACT|nr:hypothetical protein [Stieleria neptunia]QDV40772.1 hypothetical protein Enr13x_06080 [Stieleria neptunia]
MPRRRNQFLHTLKRLRKPKHQRKTRRRRKLSLEALAARTLMAADLGLVDEGLEGAYFSELQSQLNADILSVRAPLIGDVLGVADGDSSELRSQFVSDLGNQLQELSLDGGVSVAEVRSQLIATLGITEAEIQITGQDGDSDIRFEIQLSGAQQVSAGVDLDLVGAAPEIELLLGNENAVDVDLQWHYDLAFGVREGLSGESEFYFDTSAEDELSVAYSASVRSDFDEGMGRVGVFVAEISAGEDAVAGQDVPDFAGTYEIDIADGEDHPSVSGTLLGSGEVNLAIDASFFPSFLPEGSNGLVNLGVTADGRVEYDTQLQFTGNGEVDATGNGVTVAFDNVSLDLGKLYTDFVDPVISNLQESLKPIKPVIDFLTEPVPIISDLFELGGAGPVTALTLGGASAAQIRAINVVDAILDYRGLTGADESTNESLFSFEISKEQFDPAIELEIDDEVADNLTDLANGDLKLELAEKHTDPEKHDDWQQSLDWNAEFDGSIDLPFLTDFETLAGFLLGDASIDNGASDQPEVILDAWVKGGVTAGIDLVILQFAVGGNLEFGGSVTLDLNDLPDPDVDPSLWVNGQPLWANADTPEDWNYDGRVRVPELTTIVDADPGALFNVDGSLHFGLNATLEVTVLGIPIIDEEWELFRTTLVDGSISQADDAEIIRGINPPQLGVLSDGVLTLFAGETADLRSNAEPNVTDETFTVQSLGESRLGGEVLLVTFESASEAKYVRLFDGVTKVVGDTGSGNDTIDVTRLPHNGTLVGGSGDDKVVLTQANVDVLLTNTQLRAGVSHSLSSIERAEIEGDATDNVLDARDFSGSVERRGLGGDDTLWAAGGDDIIDGGDGIDTLSGGQDGLRDYLNGGSGTDSVTQYRHHYWVTTWWIFGYWTYKDQETLISTERVTYVNW